MKSPRRPGWYYGRNVPCDSCGKPRSSTKSNELVGRGRVCNECWEKGQGIHK